MKQPTITPTTEQQEILDAVKKHRVIKVNACAGSGKSSTLRMIAEANKVKSIYMCFNKTIQLEAETKFPKHVLCRTTHALAFAKFGNALAHKLNPLYSSDIVKILGISDYVAGDSKISNRAIAALVKQTIQRFENSSDEQVNTGNIPWKEINAIKKTNPDLDYDYLVKEVVSLTKKLWVNQCNPKSNVSAGHGTYLKLWQLSKPQLDCEILYVDEAQDTNPAMIDLINNQKHCKVVYVGDAFQSIYAFRQAVNAMQELEAPSYGLTRSFRYGSAIADVAKFVISDAIDIKGTEAISSAITLVQGKTNAKYTKIFRTNAALIEEAVFLVNEGARVKCNIEVKTFKSNLQSAENLYRQNNAVISDNLAMYDTWEELVEAAEDDRELKRLVDIVESSKTARYLKALDKLSVKKDYYDILLTTAHKAKGMEWSSVVIADDFPVDKILKNTNEDGYNQQEVNLFYVACTRAINKLQLPLDFYKEYIKG